MASQLLGTVGTDGQGLSGLEYSLDDKPHGADGERRLGQGRARRGDRAARRQARPSPARTSRLTLDANIQDKAEEVLAKVGEEWKPKGATAIVMDPRDGELLALANWPRVNANDPGDAPDYARQNRAIGVTYEPGSTFKAFTVAGALEEKKVTPDTEFDLAADDHGRRPRDRRVARARLRDAQHARRSSSSPPTSARSRSASGSAPSDFDQWVRRFGFGQPTGIDLPGEEQGIVLPLERYSGSSMGNLPIGQGIAVTPMQMATAYAAIANGGMLRPAHMVESVGGRRRRSRRATA